MKEKGFKDDGSPTEQTVGSDDGELARYIDPVKEAKMMRKFDVRPTLYLIAPNKRSH